MTFSSSYSTAHRQWHPRLSLESPLSISYSHLSQSLTKASSEQWHTACNCSITNCQLYALSVHMCVSISKVSRIHVRLMNLIWLSPLIFSFALFTIRLFYWKRARRRQKRERVEWRWRFSIFHHDGACVCSFFLPPPLSTLIYGEHEKTHHMEEVTNGLEKLITPQREHTRIAAAALMIQNS
jgi:hypothetical protein